MLQFPLQELMDERRCYEYLLKVLHREGPQCSQGHPLSEEQQLHDHHCAPIVAYRCRECGVVFNLFTGAVWSGTRYSCSQIVLLLGGVAPGVSPRITWHRSWVWTARGCWSDGRRFSS